LHLSKHTASTLQRPHVAYIVIVFFLFRKSYGNHKSSLLEIFSVCNIKSGGAERSHYYKGFVLAVQGRTRNDDATTV